MLKYDSIAIIYFLLGFISGYAFLLCEVKFERRVVKVERQKIQETKRELKIKYEEIKRLEHFLIKHGFLKHGKQRTTEED